MADVTRLEQFLNHIAHPEDPVPTPQTRLEHKFKEIAENKGGGGGVLVVNFTMTMGDGDTPEFAADKTFAEIMAANTAGQRIVGYFSLETNNRMTLELTVFAPQGIAFVGIDLNKLVAGTPKLDVYRFIIMADNSISSDGGSFALTPAT